MSTKFFYVYLIGGIVALILFIYHSITNAGSGLLFDIIPAVLLFYMAYKTYHEKNDQELM